MADRPFNIGVMIWLDQPVSSAPELAAAAEKAGFSEIWLADHYFLRDVYVSLAMMAQATERVRLGTAVAAVQLRHPALLASSAATVDELSNGRAIIGIGPGGHEFAAQFRMSPESPLTMMREAATIIRNILRGETQVEGRYYSALGSKLTWQTRQIPINIAARGPQMTVLAGEIADGVLIHGINKDYIDYVKEQLQLGAERAGRTADECEIGVILDVDVDNDVAAAVNRLRPRLKITAGGAWSNSLIPVYNLDPQAVKTLKAAVSAGDPNAPALVTDEMVHTFGIAGSPKTIAQQLGRLRESGLRRVVLKFEGTVQETIHQMQDIKPIILEVCS